MSDNYGHDAAAFVECRYLQTHRKARALTKYSTPATHEAVSQTIQDLWEDQHARGAQDITAMLRDLKGFYLKLGQILGSKADVLPQVYTVALSALFDGMPAASNRHVQQTIQQQLEAPLQQVSPSDTSPLSGNPQPAKPPLPSPAMEGHPPMLSHATALPVP